METGSYNVLLGNDWMMKAGATYNWKNQELTIDWRNQTTKLSATCKQIEGSDNETDEYSDDEDEETILFQGNYKN